MTEDEQLNDMLLHLNIEPGRLENMELYAVNKFQIGNRDAHLLINLLLEEYQCVDSAKNARELLKINALGKSILRNHGSLSQYKINEQAINNDLVERRLLEKTAAISNIEANELNAENSKYIRTERLINIGMGIINIIAASINMWFFFNKS